MRGALLPLAEPMLGYGIGFDSMRHVMPVSAGRMLSLLSAINSLE